MSHQIAIGAGNLQVSIGEVNGGVVNIVAPPQRSTVRPRPTPVSLRPRPFPDLLDRQAEVGAATAAFPSGAPVEFHAPPGLGKTALLRHLAHHPAASAMPDGVIYLSASRQPLEDLLQALFDAFYESDVAYKPTAVQIEQGLQGKRALVILDDVGLSRDEVAALMNSAPSCAFLLASPTRCLWGEGTALTVSGLPPDDACRLLERELGRVLSAGEQAAARDLCTRLGGHPLHVLQTAALVRERNLPLAEAAQQVLSGVDIVRGLADEEQRVAAALAALDAPVSADHAAAVAGIADARPPLESLVRRGLVQRHSPRYSLTGALADGLRRSWDLRPLEERALSHFTAWAESNRAAPQRLLESSEPILHVLERAVEGGRWAEVLRLGRALEGALALGGRWGAWLRVLRWLLQAAQALGDRVAEGWALHQLGTRALCLGEKDGARDLLTRALQLRESIGDQAGAAVTRHNLGFLAAPPTPPRPPAKPAPTGGLSTAAKVAIGILGGLGGLAVLVAVIVGAIWWFNRPVEPPRPVPLMTEAPSPSVTIELAGGCAGDYAYGARTTLRLTANVAGRAELWLEDGDSRLVEEAIWLTPGQAWSRPWTFGEFEGRQAQWFAFRAVLYDEANAPLTEAACRFHYTGATEIVDNEPPPAPVLLAPSPQQTLNCSAQPALVHFSWEAVDDPSGIAYYTVQAEAVVYEMPIAPLPAPLDFAVEGTVVERELDCGRQYRWRVQAVDRAGNEGPWSDWGYFVTESNALDSALPPTYGARVFPGSCFSPDPAAQAITSGGPIDVSASLGAFGCRGYAAQAPDFRIEWQDADTDQLTLYFVAATVGDDTTLIVQDPNGNWHCDDDSGEGVDPQVQIAYPPPGVYNIWVGSYQQGTFVGGTLYITAGCIY